jgi:hypothetical protein
MKLENRLDTFVLQLSTCEKGALNLNWWTWDHARGAFAIIFLIILVASSILVPISKILEQKRLDRLPDWLRWLLVLPTALVVYTLAEVVARVLFAVLEIAVNHELVFKPHFDAIVWLTYEPLVFVMAGAQMAPRKWGLMAFALLALFKMLVAGINCVHDLASLRGHPLECMTDPITGAPIWWEVGANGFCVLLLVAFLVAFRTASEPPMTFPEMEKPICR